MSQVITPQKAAVPTQGTLDEPMLEFINNVADFADAEMLQEFWGVCNKLTGLARYTPKQADAFILAAEQLVDLLLISVPPWEDRDTLLFQAQNMLQLVKTQVWRATTNDMRNERAHIATSGSTQETRTVSSAPRQKRFGVI